MACCTSLSITVRNGLAKLLWVCSDVLFEFICPHAVYAGSIFIGDHLLERGH